MQKKEPSKFTQFERELQPRDSTLFTHSSTSEKKKTAYDKPTKVKQRLFKSDLPSVVLISGWTLVIEDNVYFSSTMTRVIFSRIFSMNNGVYYLLFKNWAQLIKGLLALNLG